MECERRGAMASRSLRPGPGTEDGRLRDGPTTRVGSGRRS